MVTEGVSHKRRVDLRRFGMTPCVLAIILGTTAMGCAQAKSLPRSADDTTSSEAELKTRSIAALKRLENLVLDYRSLAEFETNGRIARVSFEIFSEELEVVFLELQPLLRQLPESNFKKQISNALYSYRDGAFWWSRIRRPKVIHGSALSFEATQTLSDSALASTIPYTVVIHWRQARKYLSKAKKVLEPLKEKAELVLTETTTSSASELRAVAARSKAHSV